MSYATAAPKYREAGWAGVIPLQEREKDPPPVGFTGRGGKDPTPAQIDAWIAGKPYKAMIDGVLTSIAPVNIALRLPDGVIGYDADFYKDEGRETHAKLVARCGELPPTWISTSRDDGSGIRLYRVPLGTELRGKAGEAGEDGVEIIQHHHRYAVTWPSIHPEGREYRWITPEGEISDVPPRPDQLPELPKAWLKALSTPDPMQGEPRAKTTDSWSEKVNRRYAESLADLTASRHDNTRDHVLCLARYEERGEKGATEALEALGRAFRMEVTNDGSRSGPEAVSEWSRMLDGARRIVEADPTPTQRKSRSTAAVLLTPDSEELTEDAEAVSVEYLDLADISKNGIPPLDWLVDGWLTSTDIALFAGGGGIGKTTTAGALAVSLAKGEPWCGVPVSRAVRVLYFDEEAGATETARTFLRLGAPHPNLKVASEQGIQLTYEGVERLAAEIEAFDAKVVFLDSVQQTFAAKENDSDEIGAVYGRLFRLRARYGVAFFLLHHKKKAQGFVVDAIELVRGSSAHGTQASTVWCAAPGDGPDRLNIIVPKRRGASKPSLVIAYSSDGNNEPIILTGEGQVEDADTALERAVGWVLEYLSDRDEQATKVVRAAGKAAGHKDRTVDRALRHLKKLGRAAQPKRGFWVLVTAPEGSDAEEPEDGADMAQSWRQGQTDGAKPTTVSWRQAPTPIEGWRNGASERAESPEPAEADDALPEDITRCCVCNEIVDRRHHDTGLCGLEAS